MNKHEHQKKHVRSIVKRRGFNRHETSWKHLKAVQEIKCHECLSVPPGACIATASPPSSHGNQHRHTSCSPAKEKTFQDRWATNATIANTPRHLASQPKATGLGFESVSASAVALSFFLAASSQKMADNIANIRIRIPKAPIATGLAHLTLQAWAWMRRCKVSIQSSKKCLELLPQGTSSNTQSQPMLCRALVPLNGIHW